MQGKQRVQRTIRSRRIQAVASACEEEKPDAHRSRNPDNLRVTVSNSLAVDDLIPLNPISSSYIRVILCLSRLSDNAFHWFRLLHHDRSVNIVYGFFILTTTLYLGHGHCTPDWNSPWGHDPVCLSSAGILHQEG